MALTITREERENRQLVLNVEAPKERVEKELQKAAKKISSQYGVPGFRKGKAPYSMIVRTYGLANLYSEFVDNLGQEMYKAAIEQEKIEPYAMAQLEDIQMEPTLTYKLVVPLEHPSGTRCANYRRRTGQPAPRAISSAVCRLARCRSPCPIWRHLEPRHLQQDRG